MKQSQIDAIRDNLNERISTHINSMCTTEDEVSLAVLLCHIDDLENELEDCHKQCQPPEE